MLYQTGSNIEVSYKEELDFGVELADRTGAKRFRLNGGGLNLAQAQIMSNEKRGDMQSSMGRGGSRSVTGGYTTDLSVGGTDDLLEAGLRGEWDAAVDIPFATMTSITTVADGIVAAAGSWITQGVKVGQVLRLANHSTAGNNGKNLRVVGVTAAKISVPTGDLIADAAPDAAGTVTITKRVSQPSSIIRRSYCFEENEKDIIGSELFYGNRINGLRLTGGPDTMAVLEVGIVGANGRVLTAISAPPSPFFDAPSLSTGIGLTFADAVIRLGGEDLVNLTAFEVALGNAQAGQPVIGSKFTPDVFDGKAGVTGSVSAIRRDLLNVQRALDETELELHVMLLEPGGLNFVSVFLGRLKFTTPSKDLSGEGAFIETLPFTVGSKDVVSGYDPSMVLFSTSAA